MKDTSLSNTSFHDKLTRLEAIHNQLKEMETTDLELLIALYQEGTILSKELNQTLTHFEQKIIEIDEIQVESPSIAPSSRASKPSSRESAAEQADTDFSTDISSGEQSTETAISDEEQSTDTITHYVADLFSDIDDDETEE